MKGRLLAVGNLEFCNLRLLLSGRPFILRANRSRGSGRILLVEQQVSLPLFLIKDRNRHTSDINVAPSRFAETSHYFYESFEIDELKWPTPSGSFPFACPLCGDPTSSL